MVVALGLGTWLHLELERGIGFAQAGTAWSEKASGSYPLLSPRRKCVRFFVEAVLVGVTMIDDAQLLRRYVESRSEAAFTEFVGRHLNLVYFATLRRANENAALAKDITQYVFTAAAREAASLMHHATVAGWLYTTTRNAAAKTIRSEQIRQRHEEELNLMGETRAEPPIDWDRLRPVIDESLDALNARGGAAALFRGTSIRGDRRGAENF